MKLLRWLSAILYVLIIIGLFGFAYSAKVPQWLYFPFDFMYGKLFWTIFIIVVTMISQLLFVLSTGKIDLHRPKNKFWVLVPIAVAALLLAFLTYAFIMSIYELLRMSGLDNWLVFFIIVWVFWVVWGVVFFRQFKNAGKHEVLKGLVSTLITGSALELLPAILMHFVTSRRGGCFAGMYTGLGISFGIVVMLWSFGPGIIFLFMHAKYKAEIKKSADKVQISPDTAEDTRRQ